MNGFAKPSILVVCQTNQCLSQMAAGFLQAFAGDLFDTQSAGMSPADSLHPLVVKVMAEAGMNIGRQRPKHVNQFLGASLDTLIFLSAPPGNLELPAAGSRHDWFFDDPSLTAATQEQRLALFRRVRDDIRRVCEAYASGRADAETAHMIRWPCAFTPV